MISAVLAALLLCVASNAHAWNCDDVRSLVRKVGEKKAAQIARAAGATEEEIKSAREECLKSK